MSDPSQNKRSPDQQFATIDENIKRQGRPWKVVRTERDDGIKGRFKTRRPGLMRLLNDIASGRLEVNAILVDTYERFGRAEEFAEIRRKLYEQYGVLILAADTGFADPTGVAGKAMGLIESIRSTEDGRIKAHNVIRGKKDSVRLKRWPGGPVPFGYKLKKILIDDTADSEVYSVLEINDETAWIIRKIFRKAFEKGWGASKIARCINADPEMPDKFKPFYAPTINYWLKSEIYLGTCVWGANNTDIINDSRVIEANPDPADIERMENFCEPLITVDIFMAIRKVREARSTRPQNSDGDKLIKPMAPGMTLKYPLSGLVRCGTCGAAKIARGSGCRGKAGDNYVYYCCSRAMDGACGNKCNDHEDRLRQAVLRRVRANLFPVSTSSGDLPAWLGDIVSRVERELNRRSGDQPDRAEEIKKQIAQIEESLSGWSKTLSKPNISDSMRSDFEAQYERAQQEKNSLKSTLERQLAQDQHLRTTLNPNVVIEALRMLDEALLCENASLINIELAKHIDSITSFPDGRVVLRGTYLGLFQGGVELLSTPTGNVTSPPVESASEPKLIGKVQPRRLARRRTGIADELIGISSNSGMVDSQPGLNPHRFVDLPKDFVWETSFVLERKGSWSEVHANEVLQYVRDHPDMSLKDIAPVFGVTRPTISHALRIADPEGKEHAVVKHRGPKPAVLDFHQIIEEVGKDLLENTKIKDIARRLGVSYPTVAKARDAWFASRGETAPDGRGKWLRNKKPPETH